MLRVQNRMGKLEQSSTIGMEMCERHPDNQLLKDFVAGGLPSAPSTSKLDL